MSELGEPEIDPALPPVDSFDEYNPPDGNADTPEPEPEDDAAALIAGSAHSIGCAISTGHLTLSVSPYWLAFVWVSERTPACLGRTALPIGCACDCLLCCSNVSLTVCCVAAAKNQ